MSIWICLLLWGYHPLINVAVIWGGTKSWSALIFCNGVGSPNLSKSLVPFCFWTCVKHMLLGLTFACTSRLLLSTLNFYFYSFLHLILFSFFFFFFFTNCVTYMMNIMNWLYWFCGFVFILDFRRRHCGKVHLLSWQPYPACPFCQDEVTSVLSMACP